MKVIGTVIRWFTLGAIAGLLIAPRAGHDTRAMISERFNHLLDGSFGGDSGGALHKEEYASSGDAREVNNVNL